MKITIKQIIGYNSETSDFELTQLLQDSQTSDATKLAAVASATKSGTVKIEDVTCVETYGASDGYAPKPTGDNATLLSFAALPKASGWGENNAAPIAYWIKVDPEVGDCETTEEADLANITLTMKVQCQVVNNRNSAAQYDSSVATFSDRDYYALGLDNGQYTGFFCSLHTGEFPNETIRIVITATYDSTEYYYAHGFYLPKSNYNQCARLPIFNTAIKRVYNSATGKYVYSEAEGLQEVSGEFYFEAIYANKIALPTAGSALKKLTGYLPRKFVLLRYSTSGMNPVGAAITDAIQKWNAGTNRSWFDTEPETTNNNIYEVHAIDGNYAMFFDKPDHVRNVNDTPIGTFDNYTIVALYEPIKISYYKGSELIVEQQQAPDANGRVYLLKPEDDAANGALDDVVTSTPTSIAVTLNANDGTLTGDSTLYIPTINTKTFRGWGETASSEYPQGIEDETTGDRYIEVTANTTTDKKFYLLYDESDANGTVTLPSAQYITREGYDFAGWWSAAEGGNKAGDGGAAYATQSSVTLYAHWRAIRYIPHIIKIAQGTADVEAAIQAAATESEDTMTIDTVGESIDPTTPHWEWVECERGEVPLKACVVVLGTAYDASTATSGWTIVHEFCTDEVDGNGRLTDYCVVLYQPSTKTIKAIAVPSTGWDEGMEHMLTASSREFGRFKVAATNRTTPLDLIVRR